MYIKKINRNRVFDCHLSPDRQQMAIKNIVSSNSFYICVCWLLRALSNAAYWSTKSFEVWLYLQYRYVVLEKKGFRHLFTFIIKTLTYTYVPSRLAHFTHSASIVWNTKTQRSLVRGRGTSISIIALKASGRDCTNKNELLHKIGVLQRYAMQLFVFTR